MIFKRNEGFRFTFEQPVKAAFRLMKNGEPIEPQASYIPAEILDISPKGMKISTAFNIKDELSEDVQFFIIYCLDTLEIQSYGEMVWKRRNGDEFVYGLYFHAQEENEQKIISELKTRRRKELKIGERRS
ncbi:PilZ domain-containing protein [Caryophanon latum]|uniref:PilZ domain-containing protein n=1 Tax=Caryophanon latum TaxID=33977 RepID=A0A1C0Z2L0_9BACL|nr:PilZ domain-containing protein [Caryophanon latum]OCS93608.1 hypothetical protein A6K76_04525 [Caryophanon latum]